MVFLGPAEEGLDDLAEGLDVAAFVGDGLGDGGLVEDGLVAAGFVGALGVGDLTPGLVEGLAAGLVVAGLVVVGLAAGLDSVLVVLEGAADAGLPGELLLSGVNALVDFAFIAAVVLLATAGTLGLPGSACKLLLLRLFSFCTPIAVEGRVIEVDVLMGFEAAVPGRLISGAVLFDVAFVGEVLEAVLVTVFGLVLAIAEDGLGREPIAELGRGLVDFSVVF